MNDESKDRVPAPGESSGAPSAETAPAGAPVVPAPPANLFEADDEAIARAAAALRAGEVVAFPTETVYGLGADAGNPQAVARVFEIKGRPLDHPVIVHLASTDDLPEWVGEIPESATRLAEVFWPGPLTLILKRAPQVPDAVTGGQETVGVRVPAHPVARALLEAFRGTDGERRFSGIAAPSANKYGRISPTTAAHVRGDLGDAVGMILDGGATEVGIESTIVDLSGEYPVLLRPGAIGAAELARELGEALRVPDAQAPRAPGRHATHYAPRAKLRLVKRVAMLEALASHKGQRIGVLALEVTVPRLAASLQRVVPAVPARYAHELYAHLRALDALNVNQILVETPPQTPAWSAINDRLARATRGGERGMEDAA